MHANGIDAVYYVVKDFEAQRALYARILGFAPAPVAEGKSCEWTFSDGATFGLFRSRDGAARGSGVLFRVDDVATAVEECRGLGVRFDDDGRIDETSVCRMAYAIDPEGLTFVLHERKPSKA
jgi:predicted enzyme related to lactoylglutathione lyase